MALPAQELRSSPKLMTDLHMYAHICCLLVVSDTMIVVCLLSPCSYVVCLSVCLSVGRSSVCSSCSPSCAQRSSLLNQVCTPWYLLSTGTNTAYCSLFMSQNMRCMYLCVYVWLCVYAGARRRNALSRITVLLSENARCTSICASISRCLLSSSLSLLHRPRAAAGQSQQPLLL